MNVNSTHHTFYAPHPPSSKLSDVEVPKSTMQSASIQVQISDNAKYAQEKWQSIANQYDVHNISDAEAGAMSRELFDSGFINTTQMMILMAPSSMDGSQLKKHDLLNDMKHTFKLSNALGGHTQASKNAHASAINILERLDETKQTG
ncbi:hypothetical protein J8M21_03140 [Pseudoalteromonas luteoviolacea]|uniref:hypothetical protein n=1 Tax=Pseudoalteromonas luteoviolacea TaxID=43657 RepID=UPI001B3598FE|nr:hypothetical protein [Pseudoalteromonas luteoviolacea]MBQ4876202.1 hypothetical protein [Pseudoalteromonas luteoviolacea]MBQ4906236.1 hypothetical protein [Pseudoalteromonas luteoviolacea]